MAVVHLVKHYGKYFHVREDYLKICDNDSCCAKILDLMEYWTQCRDYEIKRVRSHNTKANKNSIPTIQEPDYWLYETIDDIRTGLFNEYGTTYIKFALKRLKAKGFIDDKQSANKFDKTRLYKLNITEIQKALDNLYQAQTLDITEQTKLTLDQSKVSFHQTDLSLEESKVSLDESNLSDDLYSLNILNKQSSLTVLANTPPEPGVPTHEDETEDLLNKDIASQQGNSTDQSTHEETTPKISPCQEEKAESLHQQVRPSLGATLAAGSFDKAEQLNESLSEHSPKQKQKPVKFQSIEDLIDHVLLDPGIMASDPLPSVYKNEIKMHSWRFPWRTATRDKIYQTCNSALVELIAKERASWSQVNWEGKIPTVMKSISNMESTKGGLEELMSYWDEVKAQQQKHILHEKTNAPSTDAKNISLIEAIAQDKQRRQQEESAKTPAKPMPVDIKQQLLAKLEAAAAPKQVQSNSRFSHSSLRELENQLKLARA